LTNLPNLVYLDASSSVQTQLNSKQAILSNAAYLDATSSIQTQLNNYSSILTGCTYDTVYLYLNMVNNLHVYGKIQLAGLSTDITSTFADVYTNLATKQATLSNASFLDATSSIQTQINSINTNLSGKQSTLSNASFLDFTSSGQTQLNNKQTTITDTLHLINSSSVSSQINFDTYIGRATPSSIIQAVDNNYSSDIIFSNALQDTSGSTIASQRMIISSLNGYVGINKTLPSYYLDVGGSINGLSYYLNGVLLPMSYFDATSSIQTQINSINTTVSGGTTLTAVQSNNNTWTGTNVFNAHLPTSTATPINTYDLTTKYYVDGLIATKTTLSAVQSNNNSWTGTNAFNTSLPTSVATPVNTYDLTTKYYVDGQLTTKQNTITSSTTFNMGALTCTSLSCTSETDTGNLTVNNITSSVSNLNINAPSTYSTNLNINGSSILNISSSGIYVTGNISCSGSVTYIPAGSIHMSIASTMTGYLLCNGASYSTTTYSALYAVIGTAYGGGTGTFNVPDFRGMFLRGIGTNGTYTQYTGPTAGNIQLDGIASHNHSISFPNSNYQYGNNSGNFGFTTGGNKSVESTGNYSTLPTTTNNQGGTETNPVNYGVNYFVKT
jgi:microcystin-dependent protein